MEVYSNTKNILQCISLAHVMKYNLIALSDVHQEQSDVQGRIAVGGNAHFESFTVGGAICDPPTIPCLPYATDTTLMVGGNLNWNEGTNWGGNTVITRNSSYDVASISYTNANDNRQPIRTNNLPFSFTTLFTFFKTAANHWADLSSPEDTIQVLNYYGNIFMIGLNTELNIFNITASQIAPLENIIGFGGNSFIDIHSITIIAPPLSTNLINVSDNIITFGNFSIFRSTNVPDNLLSPSDITDQILQQGTIPFSEEKRLMLWNFYNATEITTSNISFQGTLLAPYAKVYTLAGNIEGNVIVDSYLPCLINTNHTEIHNYPFKGYLPKLNRCTTTHCRTTTTTHCPTTTTTHCPTTTTTHCPNTTTTHCPTTTTTHCPTTTTTHCPTTTTTHCPTTTTTHCPTTTTTHCPTTTTTHCPTTTTTHCPTTTTTHCPTTTTSCTISTTTTPCTISTTTYPYYCCPLLWVIKCIWRNICSNIACFITLTVITVIFLIIGIILIFLLL